MTTYIIPQKQSGTGSIHDIASELFDRVICFAPGHIYAVVLASYYGGRGCTTHESEESVIAACEDVSDFSHTIIDINGDEYVAHGVRLVKKCS